MTTVERDAPPDDITGAWSRDEDMRRYRVNRAMIAAVGWASICAVLTIIVIVVPQLVLLMSRRAVA